MALTTCRECGREVSDSALACPHCGAPRPGSQQWRGTGFEWQSTQTYLGYPLIHVAFGRDARGKYRVAKGIIAIGQFAVGLVTIAQFGVGLLFGFGQFILGFTALAQVAVTAYFGVGQVAVGYVAIGQIVLAHYGLAQIGWATHLLSPGRQDPEAVEYFRQLLLVLKSWTHPFSPSYPD
ncbi:MAG: zinc ribbon domain-containing protein [Desulfobaccales bacterium]